MHLWFLLQHVSGKQTRRLLTILSITLSLFSPQVIKVALTSVLVLVRFFHFIRAFHHAWVFSWGAVHRFQHVRSQVFFPVLLHLTVLVYLCSTYNTSLKWKKYMLFLAISRLLNVNDFFSGANTFLTHWTIPYVCELRKSWTNLISMIICTNHTVISAFKIIKHLNYFKVIKICLSCSVVTRAQREFHEVAVFRIIFRTRKKHKIKRPQLLFKHA